MREGDGRLYCWNWEACNGDLYRCSPQWVDGGGMGACRVTSISCGSRHLAALTGASSKATREAHENPNENILDIARLKPFCRFESVVELSLGGLKGEIINTGGWKDEEEERLPGRSTFQVSPCVQIASSAGTEVKIFSFHFTE
eukprot:GHVT01095797.1.p2 GENE.GHVT01095797.1~~GHVT01095797.1.p2  ORF type:complete len:143 (-),score=18.55 GHVT01095797.1:175-603(-)